MYDESWSAIHWICLFFLLNLAALNAQPIKVAFHELTPLQGLSQGSNAFVSQDSKGFTWISSIDGLNRFDGRNVQVYRSNESGGPLDNIITSNCFEDVGTDLWFTSYEGINYFSRRTGEFQHFQLIDTAGDTIRQDYYAFKLDDIGRLWVRTGLGKNGLLHLFDLHLKTAKIIGPLDGGRIQSYVDSQKTEDYLLAHSFIGRTGISISRLADTLLTTDHFTSDDLLPDWKIFGSCQDSVGQLWLASEAGLVAFNHAENTFELYDSYISEQLGTVWAIAALDTEHLLVSTRQKGLFVFSVSERTFTQQLPTEPNRFLGLKLDRVNGIYIDSTANVWLSSPRKGINFGSLRKNKFQEIGALQNVAGRTFFEARDGSVWSNGNAGEVYHFFNVEKRPIIFRIKGESTTAPLRQVSFFFEDELGQVWAGTGKSLFRLNSERKHFEFQFSLPAAYLSTVLLSNGSRLIATYEGIYELTRGDDGELAAVPFKDLGKAQDRLATALYEDTNNNLYLAVDAKALLVLSPGQSGYTLSAELDRTGYVRSFYEASDTVWMATSNGLLSIDKNKWGSASFSLQNGGIPAASFYCILPDDLDNFWLSSNQGIVTYNRKKKEFHRFIMSDGIQGLEYNADAFLRTRSGDIWLGGNYGTNVFKPEEIIRLSVQPKLCFTNILINDEPYRAAELAEEINYLELPYSMNTISLTAAAMEYSDPENNRYRYRLKNYETDWVEGGTSGFLRYPNLPPGKYTLQVLAANSDEIWTTKPKELSIMVKTPWWRSWWFMLSCFVVLGLLVYAIFNYRLQQALKVERIRVKISSDLHDDVGSILTGLAMQAEVMELTAAVDNKEKLGKISSLSRSALARMRDTVWAIDSRKEKLQDLVFRIQEHAEETLVPAGFNFIIDLDAELDLEQKLASDVRQNIYLIAKEAITNTAKHSNGKRATFLLRKKGKGLTLSIHDNGSIQHKKYPSAGQGQSNMQMRADQIGANLSVSIRNGYTVTLSIASIS